jgi:hypothetical protein
VLQHIYPQLPRNFLGIHVLEIFRPSATFHFLLIFLDVVFSLITRMLSRADSNADCGPTSRLDPRPSRSYSDSFSVEHFTAAGRAGCDRIRAYRGNIPAAGRPPRRFPARSRLLLSRYQRSAQSATTRRSRDNPDHRSRQLDGDSSTCYALRPLTPARVRFQSPPTSKTFPAPCRT